jgi:hypothetical protein
LFRCTDPGFGRAKWYALVAGNFGGGQVKGTGQENGTHKSWRKAGERGSDLSWTLLDSTPKLWIRGSQGLIRTDLNRIQRKSSLHPNPVQSGVTSDRSHPRIERASFGVEHRSMFPGLFKGNLCDIFSGSGVANDPECDATQSTRESLDK